MRASEAKSGQPTREKFEHSLKSAYNWRCPQEHASNGEEMARGTLGCGHPSVPLAED